MKKSTFKLIISVCSAILLLGVGLFVWDLMENEQQVPQPEIEPVYKALVYITYGKPIEKLTEADLTITEEDVDKYREILNSEEIQAEIRKKYPDVQDARLERESGTRIFSIIYKDEEQDASVCVEITNQYAELFAQNFEYKFGQSVTLVERAEVPQ